jgi:hypothetical protein
MAGLRFLPLLAIAACADLSGLNGLEVSDGATAQDASPQDATDDTTADDADAIVPLDAQNVDGITPPTFCQTQNQTYTWCADFDEGDVVYGYLNGVTAKWSAESQKPPTLSTHNASAPNSAGFDGALAQSLAFTGATASTTGYEFIGQLRIESGNDQSTGVAAIQVSTGYSLKLFAVRLVSTSTFTVTIDEATTSDASTVITPHALTGTFQFATWVWWTCSSRLRK